MARIHPLFLLSVGTILAFLPESACAGSASDRAVLQQIRNDTQGEPGLIVQLGCSDGELTRALRRLGDRCLVQVWDTDPAAVARTRREAQDAGLYGELSADVLDGNRLPYIDNLVNVIVVEKPFDVPRQELMRVLRPEGIAYVRSKVDDPRSDIEGRWQKIVKPRPAEIDDWTHYLYDASNNAVSHDTVVAPPRHMQWLGSPRYSRHHDRMSSVSACVSAGGRVFYIIDEGSPVSTLFPPKWTLIARDAFNGIVLWKRPLENWYTHLWPLKSGPAQLPRRLIAEGDRVYVTLRYDGAMLALDAATGKTVSTYEGTKSTEEAILIDDMLVVLVNESLAEPAYANMAAIHKGYGARFWDESPRRIVAVRASTGERQWSEEYRVLPGTLAADGDRVVFHDGESVVCLARDTGRRLWRSEPLARVDEVKGFFIPILVLYDDVVLFSGGETAGQQTGSWYMEGQDTMTALSAKTGKQLWKAYHPPSGYRSPEDLLVVDGLVWTGETTSGRAVGVFSGRDPVTGEVKREFPPDVSTYWFHHRCYRGKATDNYLLMSRTGIEFLDVREQTWSTHHWVRGACLYGVMPANGLVYAPQHPCACYLEAKQYGFNALAPASESQKERIRAGSKEPRLEKGPVYASLQSPVSGLQSADDWPTYRGNAARSGRTAATVPSDLRTAWSETLGGKLTAPVVAEGRVYVASVDNHLVHALDADSGRVCWQFTAGGRVDSPPTVYQDLVLFGSTDGFVYCLRAADGQLAWRFLAAPIDERLTSFEHVESVWPVHGSVLVLNDVLYCVAGRSMFLDGGLRLWRLTPRSGEVLSETVLDDRDAPAEKNLQDYVSWLNMPPAMTDILSSDGRNVYMRSQPFQLDGTRLPLEAMPNSGNADAGAPPPTQQPELAHLFSPTGFLDDTWWHRTYWLYGSRYISGWCGYFLAGKGAPAGRILVYDEDRVYGFGRKPKYYRWTTPIEHQLFAAEKFVTPADDEGKAPNQIPYRVRHHWTQDVPLFARAMVLTDGTLFAAGPPDRIDEEQAWKNMEDPLMQAALAKQAAVMEGAEGAILWAVSTADGAKQCELALDSCPVFDGMAAARARLYISTLDGKVLCLGGK